ncbi:MAG: cupredoxin domain-containing protein [Candidatus Nitrosocosmicus sp.]
MRPFKIFFIFSTIALMGVTTTLSNNAFAQTVEKEIVIEPDSSKDVVYNPAEITINMGDRVIWVNKDFGIYTVTENQGLFGSKDLRPDQTFEYTFENTGTYEYHCKLHPEMVGKIIVT